MYIGSILELFNKLFTIFRRAIGRRLGLVPKCMVKWMIDNLHERKQQEALKPKPINELAAAEQGEGNFSSDKSNEPNDPMAKQPEVTEILI